MSRLHSNQYNNNEFMNNCESYISKMIKNKKQVVERPRTEVKVSRDKSVNRSAPNQLAVSRPVVKPGPIIRIEEPRRIPSSQDLVHKEVFNNNMATVEVTVRTVAAKGADAKPPAEEVREPWGKILTTRRSEETIHCNFRNFDPLRTLHFLSKELQLKLQNVCPGDPNIHQIVNDMQSAMQRLPPDILPQFKARETYNFPCVSSGDNEPPTNLKRYNHYDDRRSKQCQTVIIGDVERKMQQQLEDSATKFETTCKDMEHACNKLRNERDELESMLLKERETVVTLKKDLQERISEKEEKTCKEVNKLISERDSLKKQVTELQTNMKLQEGQAAEDLRSLVEELRNKQLTIEQENTTRKNELTLMKLERDKMNVLLECRDKQLKELRNELECIQQLVTTQLLEFKTKPSFSTTSTMSCASQLWNTPSTTTRPKKFGKSVHELFLNNDVMRKMLLSKELQIVESGTITTMNVDEIIKEQHLKLDNDDMREIPQRDKSECKIQQSEMTISDAGMDNEFMHKLSSPSIKNMFAEIKRQAFKKLDVTLPPIPIPSQNKDVATTIDSQVGLDSRASLSS